MKKFRRLIFFFLLPVTAVAVLYFFLRHAPVVPVPPIAAHTARAPQKKAAPQLHQRGIVLTYEVYAAGFEALDATLTAAADEKNYTVKMTAVTRGLIGKLFRWRTTAQTTGVIGRKSGLVPRQHVETSDWRKHAYTMTMDYDAAGLPQSRVLEDNGKPMKSQPLDPKLAAGAGDVLTATLALLQNVAHTGKCAGSYPVYDGRRRYDVTLADDGTSKIAPSRYSIFSGTALRCHLKLVPVAGFTAGDKKRGWWAIQNYTERHGRPPTVWIAKAKNGMEAIVRMEIDSAYGAAVANLIGERPY